MSFKLNKKYQQLKENKPKGEKKNYVELINNSPKTYFPKTPLDVVICTPDINLGVTQRCLRTLYETTKHIEYNLIIFDNHYEPNFKHAAWLNKALNSTEQSKHNLLILDDDVYFLETGWLESGLEYLDNNPETGIVGYTLYRRPKEMWRSVMWHDKYARMNNMKEEFTVPVYTPASCSCCWLMTPTNLRFNTNYDKYIFEIEFCYEMWTKTSKDVVILPDVVYHSLGVNFN